ncbi:hypothetical protein ACE6H2_014991 [Prunus campanulata]
MVGNRGVCLRESGWVLRLRKSQTPLDPARISNSVALVKLSLAYPLVWAMVAELVFVNYVARPLSFSERRLAEPAAWSKTIDYVARPLSYLSEIPLV